MANLSSPPSPANSSSELSKLGLNPSSPLYLYQMEQLKMLQRNQGLPDLAMLYNNPAILYTANPFWWQQLIFSLPPVFGNNLKKEKQDSPKHEPMSREYILTPETPERDDHYEMEMDEPLNLSKKNIRRDTDISSSLLSPLLPPTSKINPNLFSAIWSPASLVGQNEKSFGFKSDSVESSPTTPKMKFNFDNVHAMSIKRESSSQIDYGVLKKNCTDIFLMNNNNNNNSLTFNNNLNSTFNGNDSMNILDKVPKPSRRSLPLIKPDSTEHADFVIREYRDERGKKERSFEVRIESCEIIAWELFLHRRFTSLIKLRPKLSNQFSIFIIMTNFLCHDKKKTKKFSLNYFTFSLEKLCHETILRGHRG
jgi:hypothetical protein